MAIATPERRMPLRDAVVVADEINVEALQAKLGLSNYELAEACGIPLFMLRPPASCRDKVTRERLMYMIEILDLVEVWAGSPTRALAWYRSQPLPSFGGMTAENLLKLGKEDAVKSHLLRIATTGYA